jgi:benzoyl-CoA reductase/2-hydroxyglutaryl-CoA dehydratase subunit BcrC/BadD/HgdB
MDVFSLFMSRLSGNLNRRLLSSPQVQSLARLIFLRKNEFKFKALKELAAMALDQAARAYRREEPVAWTSAFFPDELLHALNIIPFAPEAASGMAAALGLSPGLLNKAEEIGFSKDGCSFHRCAAAGTEQDLFPRPDMLLASSHLCDGAPQLFQYLSRRYNRPLFLLDVPAAPGEAAEQYLSDQLKELAAWLERHSGRKLTGERLEKAFSRSNRAREMQLQVNELRRDPASPLDGGEALAFFYLLLVGQGHPDTVHIYATLARELAEGIKNSWSRDRGRFRLIWMQLKPYYRNDLLPYLENELQARVVFEEVNDVFWPPLDPDRPYVSLTRKILSNPALGPGRRRLERAKWLAQRYNAGGVIHYSHWGCRQAVGSVYYLKEGLNQSGISFLSLDGDCVDPSNFPPGQAKTRIESFVEMLDQRTV